MSIKNNNITQKDIQELIQFINFVVNFKDVSLTAKETAKEIMYLLKNLNNTETHKNWNVSLDIFDYTFQTNNNKKEGIYLRNWVVSFENDYLNIEAESSHTSYPLGDYDGDFSFYGSIYFGNEVKNQTVFLDTSISKFLEDAINYKKYLTATLKDVEIDIEIYES